MGDHPNVLKLQFPIAYVASGEVSLYACNHRVGGPHIAK